MSLASRTLYLLFLLWMPVCETANASQTVVTQGIGTTCDDALRQAKNLAVENAAGSFLSNNRSLENDINYSETTHEFTGGVVTSYRIIATEAQTLCSVTIEAEVDIDKTTFSPPMKSKSIDLGAIGALADNRKSAVELLEKLVNRPDQFSVEVSDMAFTPGNAHTRLTFNIKAIRFTSQWSSDLEALLSTQSKPVTYEQASWGSLGKALLALATLPITIPVAIISAPFAKSESKPNEQDPNTSLCFVADKALKKINCYDSPLANELMTLLSSTPLKFALKDEQGRIHTLSPTRSFPMVFSYISPKPFSSGITSQKRGRFLLVGPSIFPNTESVVVDNKLLTPGMTLSFIVGSTSK